MFLKDLLEKLQIIYLTLESLSIFLKKIKMQCCVLNPHCWSDRELSNKSDVCSKKIHSNIFDMLAEY